MNEELTCAGCGKKHWRTQRWMHDGCVVNHLPETFTPVVNASNVVVNENVETARNVGRDVRSKDRHKKTPERLAYLRQKMKEYRARKARG